MNVTDWPMKRVGYYLGLHTLPDGDWDGADWPDAIKVGRRFYCPVCDTERTYAAEAHDCVELESVITWARVQMTAGEYVRRFVAV